MIVQYTVQAALWGHVSLEMIVMLIIPAATTAATFDDNKKQR